MSEAKSKTNFRNQMISFLSGGGGGIALTLVGQPFDLVKVRVQSGTQGVSQVISDTYKNYGIKGFYRGISAPIVGVTPVFAVCFWGYQVGQDLSKKLWGKDELDLNMIMFAGGFSAIPTTLLMTPIERVKVMLQVNQKQTIGEILKQTGARGLYKGTFATLLRDGPGSVAYFGAYEVVKKWLTPADGKLSVPAVLTAGGCAGVANWAVAIPADVLKTRLQSSSHSSIVAVFNELIAQEGFKGLFRGLGPAMTRAFPANAACFLGAELTRSFLTKTWPE